MLNKKYTTGNKFVLRNLLHNNLDNFDKLISRTSLSTLDHPMNILINYLLNEVIAPRPLRVWNEEFAL